MEQELSKIYSANVQNKGSIISTSLNSFGRSPIIERDSSLKQLENDVFSRISNLTKEHDIPRIPNKKNSDIRTVSFEEAIKELIELEKSNAAGPPPISEQ